MATDQKAGFRLPWSADRDEEDPQDRPYDGSGAAPEGGAEMAAHETPEAERIMTDEMEPTTAPTDPEDAGARAELDTAAGAEAEATAGPEAAPKPETGPATARASRSSRFRAELTKAMHAAAEQARGEALERFAAEAKSEVETIHASSASQAEDLRKASDRDIAEIRDWSKAEIARIREEAEARTGARKATLEAELEGHAAQIERRIDRVQAAVAAYEARMAGFFEALLAEEDPGRFASLAENLPEPPSFDPDAEVDEVDEIDAPVTVATTGAQDPEIAETADAVATPDPVAAEVATSPEATIEDPTAAADTRFGWPSEDPDPRVAAMGLSSHAAAEAEAEARSFATMAEDGDVEIPLITDDALAARLAGLVPAEATQPEAGVEVHETRVVVVGLISVAAIAGFKRHLTRLPGVTAVGVTSGPNGEFIFAASHAATANLRDAIPNLPGFAARVTGGDESTIDVSAHDPESDA